jgi:hypothetical protein
VAQKGSNEVLSSAHEFFVKRKTGTTRLNWWGDNTSSQMKNQFMMLYANELAHDDGFDFFTRIDNKYSPPGHTFMVHPTRARAPTSRPHTHLAHTTRTRSQENDRAFGVISRKAKKTKVIGSTKAWMELAKTAKQPNYHCIDMLREKFRDWKKYLAQRYRVPSRWKNTDNENVPFMKVRHAIAPCPSPLRAHEHHSLSLLPSCPLSSLRFAGSTMELERARGGSWKVTLARFGIGCPSTPPRPGRRSASTAAR